MSEPFPQAAPAAVPESIIAPTGKGAGAGAFGVKGGAVTKRYEVGLKHLPNGKWRASWWYGGRWIRRQVATREQARSILDAVRGQIVEGRYMDRQREVRTPFAEVADRFLEWSKANKRPGTARVDAYLTGQWKEHFRGVPIGAITVSDIERYKATRAAGDRSKKTVDNDLARLKRLFSLAVRWRLCRTNPVKEVDFFRPESRRDRFLSPEEEAALLRAAPATLRPAILFSLNTGLRQGEMLTLTWGQVDLRQGQNGQVTITAEKAKGKKTRHVPLTRTAREALDTLPRAISPEALVFSQFKGNARTFRHFWEPVLRGSGLKGVCWHTLRHTFASRLVTAGVDLTTVQQLLGHSCLAMVLKYAHLAPGHLESAVAVLDAHYQQTSNVPQLGGSEGGA